MEALAVIDDPATAVVALDPSRSTLLASLAAEPASASGLAARLGLPRQRVGYHLKALEGQGLVSEVSQRRHGGITERVLAPSAAAYVVSPGVMGSVGPDPRGMADQLSASYLVALASRVVREVGQLMQVRKGRVSSLSVDVDVCFESAAAQAAFADELADAVRTVVARHHRESETGPWFRVVAVAHPRPQEDRT